MTKSNQEFSQAEKVLIGTLLGDSFLEKRNLKTRLAIKHSINQFDYLTWKHKVLKPYEPGKITKVFDCQYPFAKFVTKTSSKLNKWQEIFYVNGRKCVPENIRTIFSSPMSLAVWFMDDGTIDKRQGSILLETQSFYEDEIQGLTSCLNRNYNLKAKIHKSGKNRGLRIYLPVKEAKEFSKIVEPYVIKQMRYKLSLPL